MVGGSRVWKCFFYNHVVGSIDIIWKISKTLHNALAPFLITILPILKPTTSDNISLRTSISNNKGMLEPKFKRISSNVDWKQRLCNNVIIQTQSMEILTKWKLLCVKVVFDSRFWGKWGKGKKLPMHMSTCYCILRTMTKNLKIPLTRLFGCSPKCCRLKLCSNRVVNVLFCHIKWNIDLH